MKTLSSERLDELMGLLLELEQDYDHGLREFQEALHYAIYLMCVTKSRHLNPKETRHAVLYLRDLAKRLKSMEEVMMKAS